jgi:hypothetical protein
MKKSQQQQSRNNADEPDEEEEEDEDEEATVRIPATCCIRVPTTTMAVVAVKEAVSFSKNGSPGPDVELHPTTAGLSHNSI